MREPHKTKDDRTGTTNKKPYRAPRLAVYGDLRTITMVKGGTKTDGGQPASKN